MHVVCITSCNARHVLLLYLCSLLYLIFAIGLRKSVWTGSAVNHISSLLSLQVEDAYLYSLMQSWGCTSYEPQAATQGTFCIMQLLRPLCSMHYFTLALAVPKTSMNRQCCRSHKLFACTRGWGCTFTLAPAKLRRHIVCITSCIARHFLLLQLCVCFSV